MDAAPTIPIALTRRSPDAMRAYYEGFVAGMDASIHARSTAEQTAWRETMAAALAQQRASFRTAVITKAG